VCLALVVFTSGIVDDAAPTGVCFSSVLPALRLLFGAGGAWVWNLGEQSTGRVLTHC